MESEAMYNKLRNEGKDQKIKMEYLLGRLTNIHSFDRGIKTGKK